jgi:hypothetical protein
MTSFELNHSKEIEENGIQMEIWEPSFIVLPIPDNREWVNTCLQINVAITNNKLTPFPFIYDILTPELLAPDGQALHPQKLTNRQINPSQYNGMGIPHKKTLSCYLIAKLSWHNNLLKLQAAISNSSQISINPDYFWSFEALQLGIYQLRFTYLSPEREFLFFDANTVEISQVQTSVTNLLATPWVNLQLIKPVESDKNAVQVDGIHFETVVPQQIWNISCSELSDTSSPIQIGINITNNTSSSQRFCSFTTLIPALMGADGFILGRNFGSGSTGWISPSESDFYLVMPGESKTFFVSVHIEKGRDGLFNLIVNDTGKGYWLLPGLKLGIYQVRLTYRTLTNLFDTELFEDLWRGLVHTPFVEFCLVQP